MGLCVYGFVCVWVCVRMGSRVYVCIYGSVYVNHVNKKDLVEIRLCVIF